MHVLYACLCPPYAMNSDIIIIDTMYIMLWLIPCLDCFGWQFMEHFIVLLDNPESDAFWNVETIVEKVYWIDIFHYDVIVIVL